MHGHLSHVHGRDDTAHLQVRGIVKRFAGVAALNGVSLSVTRGSIHALVGENGAGKSTLGRIIAGITRPDEGEILLRGEAVNFRGPRDALRSGVAAIAQELALVPARSVVDNVFLGVESHRFGVVNGARTAQRYQELAERVGFDLPATAVVGTLRLADRQKVEIMRALARGAELIVMDEPTASLTAEETQQLNQIVRELASDGTTIIFISHFLEDVLDLADTVSVLRDGELVKTSPTAEESTDSLVKAMLGRTIDVTFPERKPPPAEAPVVLEVTDLADQELLRSISFAIREGEILGLAGLVGSGRTEVARAIFGVSRSSGTVRVCGEPVELGSPRKAIKAGIAMLPESRKEQGLFMRQTTSDNITVAHLGDFSRLGLTFRRTEKRSAARISHDLEIQPQSTDSLVSHLSGGNQQKVLFGRWLLKPPRVLIADEPTRGVDVGAKRAIYNLITDLANQGMAVLFISSELEEVLGLAHRVLVMRHGEIVNELDGDQMTSEIVMRSAFAAGVAA